MSSTISNTQTAPVAPSPHAHFIANIKTEYKPQIVAELEQELRSHEYSRGSEMAALAKVLANHQTRRHATTEPFSSTPLPMDFDLAAKRKR